MNSLFNILFNLKEKLSHHSTPREIELIKEIPFFSRMNPRYFDRMMKDVRLIKYSAGTLIFKAGEPGGDALYIVLEGSARAFTFDANHNKVPLARMNEGDHFGEHTMLNKTARIANMEAIEDVTLIRIDARHVKPLIEIQPEVREHINNVSSDLTIRASSIEKDFYKELETLISNPKNRNIIELDKDETIFNIGDPPDNVYVILDGEVKILVKDAPSSRSNSVILQKGHLFGEITLLKNIPRVGTAVADTPVRLLVIPGKEFKNYVAQNPKLQHMMAKQYQAFLIPKRGIVKQFVGTDEKLGPVITNIFELEDGRKILATTFLQEDIFSMSTVDKKGDKVYIYKQSHQKRVELYTMSDHLVEIKTYGPWDNLPTLSSILLNEEKLQTSDLLNFQKTGEIQSKLDQQQANEVVCTCMSLTRQDIQQAIQEGAKDLPALSKATGVATSCGGCRPRILQMLGINPWLAATMSHLKKHNSYINSFIIRPVNFDFNKLSPGQHIVLKVKVDEYEIQRPYTVSDLRPNEMRITIKKEEKGFFTKWLFENAPEKIQMHVTQPQGEFLLNLQTSSPILCFAGGIGITPFVSFAKAFALDKPSNKMHLLYSALTEEGFVFREEFNEIAQNTPAFSVRYRPTDKEGLLGQEEVIQIVKQQGEPEIYICGPEGFVNLVLNSLKAIAYNPKKIHIEKFVHAGGK